MIKTEVSLGVGTPEEDQQTDRDRKSDWDSLRSPEQGHESILQRIKNIITSRAEAFLEQRAERRKARAEAYQDPNEPVDAAVEKSLLYYEYRGKAGEELMSQLSKERQDRIRFIKRNLDLFRNCPSVGRTMNPEEAIAIYDDYQARIENFPDDRQAPQNRLEVLQEMETMLEEQIQAAEASGDEEARVTAGTRYDMVLDLEAIASIPEYRKYGEQLSIFGSRREFNNYIRDKILREGYAGTRKMNANEVIGGAQTVEKVLKAIELLNGDQPIEEIWRTLEADENEGAIDWDPIVAFSPRGHELHTYVANMEVARRAEREAAEKAPQKEALAQSRRDIAEALASDTPFAELPEEAKKAIIEKQYITVAKRLHEMAQSERDKAETLRGRGPLDERLQAELKAGGWTRLAYAAYLGRHAEELDKKGFDVDDRKNIDDRRLAMIMRQPISRAELADSYRESADRLDGEAQNYRRRPQEFSDMFARSEDEFSRDILMVGQEGIPAMPKEVEDYLRRNYRFNISANSPLGNEPGSPMARINGLKSILSHLERVATYDYAASHPPKISVDKQIRQSIEQTISSPTYIDDYKDDSILFFEGDQAVDPDKASHSERHQFLTEQVIPSVKAVIDALEARMVSRTNAAELRPAA